MKFPRRPRVHLLKALRKILGPSQKRLNLLSTNFSKDTTASTPEAFGAPPPPPPDSLGGGSMNEIAPPPPPELSCDLYSLRQLSRGALSSCSPQHRSPSPSLRLPCTSSSRDWSRLPSTTSDDADDPLVPPVWRGSVSIEAASSTSSCRPLGPEQRGADAADEATCGFVVETRIAKFKSRPPPIPPVPVRIDSSALQTRRDSSAVASVAARRESTAVPSRRESSVAYPEYL
ncbi:hypothetical protein MTO96_009609 [Rhipicephalus appendiculatus]